MLLSINAFKSDFNAIANLFTSFQLKNATSIRSITEYCTHIESLHILSETESLNENLANSRRYLRVEN